MRDIGRYIVSCVIVGLFCTAAAGQITAIKADRIDTVTDGVIENGVILIRGTKISQIGAGIEIPGTATLIDAGDKTVFPGLVSPVSVIGLSAPQSGGPASHPHYRIADELYPHQHEYQRALQAGFTTLSLVPRGRGITGQGAIIRPVGKSRKEMLVAESSFLWIEFEANDKVKGLINKALESAKGKQNSDDPEIAPLSRSLQGEIPTFITCARAADTVHLLELLKGYDKMKLALVVGSENYRVAAQLAKTKAPVVVRATIDFEEFTRNRINVPDILAKAGVKIACMPVSTGIDAHEDFRREMAELVKYGLDKETAKKAMTIHPAEALGVDYRLGSLQKGKDANLLILDGDVLDVTTIIDKVMLEGRIVYENPWGKTQ